jgi:hypothetical protein
MSEEVKAAEEVQPEVAAAPVEEAVQVAPEAEAPHAEPAPVIPEEGKELAEVSLGSEGKLELDVSKGKLVLRVMYDGKQVDASAAVAADIDLFFDLLAAKIPGKIDDALLAVAKMALKALG